MMMRDRRLNLACRLTRRFSSGDEIFRCKKINDNRLGARMAAFTNNDGMPQSLDERRRRFELQLAREDMEIAIAIERQRQVLEINLLEIMHERISLYKKAGIPDGSSQLIALMMNQMAREIPLRLESVHDTCNGSRMAIDIGTTTTSSLHCPVPSCIVNMGPTFPRSLPKAAAAAATTFDAGVRQHMQECPSCIVHAPGMAPQKQ